MVAVRRSTTRVIPSLPGWMAVTRVRGHLAGGVSSLRMSTRSPTLTGGCCRLHFWRGFPAGTLSLLTSPSGTINEDRCMRKCDGGGKSRSEGSSVRAVKGLELRYASMRHIRVASSENDRT